jgi:hypothetical protein
MPSDAASAVSPDDKKRHFACQCVDGVVDVESKSTDGRTFTLSVGQVPVAELVVNNLATFSITRSWTAQGTTSVVQIVAAFDGSARWLDADLNAVQVKNLGQRGKVTLQCAGAPPARTFGDPIDIARTSPIQSTQRHDHIPLCNATTSAALKAAAPATDGSAAVAANVTTFTLSTVNASGATTASATFSVPSQADVTSVRDDIVALNNAVDSGDFAAASTIANRLGVPFPEDDGGHVDWTAFSPAQWNTAWAVGAITVKTTNKQITADIDPGAKVMTGMHGTGHYVALINDMAERGVPGLSAPPTFDQIHQYYANVVVEESHQSADVVAQKLLDACQRVMAGMQVHYRLAGNKDPEWGANSVQTWVLYVGNMLQEKDGKAYFFKTQAETTSFTPPAAPPIVVPVPPGGRAKVTPAKGRLPFHISPTQAPEGYPDSVSRGVWGKRYESDCDGMASFRLRTLPPMYSPVGTVVGALKKGGIGHVVAVFSGPGGLYLSSNGKVPIAVAGTGALQSAIEAEFVSIYSRHAGITGADFYFGFGIGPPPAHETPAQREPIVDRIMLEGSADGALRTWARTRSKQRRAPLDWQNFIPTWLSP